MEEPILERLGSKTKEKQEMIRDKEEKKNIFLYKKWNSYQQIECFSEKKKAPILQNHKRDFVL